MAVEAAPAPAPSAGVATRMVAVGAPPAPCAALGCQWCSFTESMLALTARVDALAQSVASLEAQAQGTKGLLEEVQRHQAEEVKFREDLVKHGRLLEVSLDSLREQGGKTSERVSQQADALGGLGARLGELDQADGAQREALEKRFSALAEKVDKQVSLASKQNKNAENAASRLAALEAWRAKGDLAEQLQEVQSQQARLRVHVDGAAKEAQLKVATASAEAQVQIDKEQKAARQLLEQRQAAEAQRQTKASKALERDLGECRQHLDLMRSTVAEAKREAELELQAGLEQAAVEMKEALSRQLGEARASLGEVIGAWRRNLSALQETCVKSLRDSQVQVTCSAQMPGEAISALAAASDLIGEQLWCAGQAQEPARRSRAVPRGPNGTRGGQGALARAASAGSLRGSVGSAGGSAGGSQAGNGGSALLGGGGEPPPRTPPPHRRGSPGDAGGAGASSRWPPGARGPRSVSCGSGGPPSWS